VELEINRSARAEMNDAAAFYAQRDVRVGLRFLAETKRCLESILASPERWPSHLYDTRRYRFRRFPYSVIYRVRGEVLRVLAVPHDHQAPGYWRRRQ
jgi:plasmid stabilization system protein ParE